jgi:hypothetical protein
MARWGVGSFLQFRSLFVVKCYKCCCGVQCLFVRFPVSRTGYSPSDLAPTLRADARKTFVRPPVSPLKKADIAMTYF